MPGNPERRAPPFVEHGESTVQGKLLRELDLFDSLKQRIEQGLPVFGTCAGLLLLAKKIKNDIFC